MKRLAAIASIAFLTGCSNAPIAGFMDTFFPAKPLAPKPLDRPVPDPLPPTLPSPPATTTGPLGPPAGIPGVTPGP